MIAKSNPILPSGIPRIPAYEPLVSGASFVEMERASNEFLVADRDNLADYGRRWVADPLHQWSHQWEYPFVLAYSMRARA